MNWYIEKDGVSQGPHSEAELEALVRSGSVVASQLIWQAGTERWDSVQLLRPQWLQDPAKTEIKTPVAAPETIRPPSDPLTKVESVPKPKRERPVSTAKPATSRLRSAPATPEAEKTSADMPAKVGLLKRLFGKKQ